MTIRYRKLSAGDVKLAKELFTWFQEDDGDPKIYVASDEYIHTLLFKNDFYVIVALDGNRLVGGLTAYELPMYKEEVTELFLYEIGVEERYREKGIATALIGHLKKLAAERGIPEMYVGTQMENHPARKLYEKTNGKFEHIAWFVYDLKK